MNVIWMKEKEVKKILYESKLKRWQKRLVLEDCTPEEYDQLKFICKYVPRDIMCFIWEGGKQFNRRWMRQRKVCPVCGDKTISL